ncbi:hypothetical protein OPT61_g4814 [Boeremia exigua]|uniref:Uncharacterized protein n=1 Tax=Boeremia exigua TaxID=749465 RepID=A0ACC2ICM0_9PLEO|nr:hypothetical protein OPT61_g4814 [Boeremia exigua]
MADKILSVRGGQPVGKNWAERLVTRLDELKMAFNWAKDQQRILQEDPEIINAWFKLVEDTKAKYGIHNNNIHNFNETGFQMGVALSSKVVTGSERRARLELVQPGDRKWVTVIKSICTARDAFLDVFTKANCQKAFKASGLVPANAQVVLDRLEVRLRTPPAVPLPETPWQLKTLSNTHEFGSQSKLISNSFRQSLSTAQEGFLKLVKGAEEMLHENVLIKARVRELEEQLAVITKRKSQKRKQIQHGGTLEYGPAALQVAAEASVAAQPSKKTRGAGSAEGGQLTVQRCGNCGKTGHNARTCQEGAEASSELDASTEYAGLLFDSE